MLAKNTCEREREGGREGGKEGGEEVKREEVRTGRQRQRREGGGARARTSGTPSSVYSTTVQLRRWPEHSGDHCRPVIFYITHTVPYMDMHCIEANTLSFLSQRKRSRCVLLCMNTPSSCPFSTARISIAFEPQPITCESPIRAREREGGREGGRREGREGEEGREEGGEGGKVGKEGEKGSSIQPLGMLTGRPSIVQM